MADVTPDTILILTPVKDARSHLPAYVRSLERLTYPHTRLSLGFLESDSVDGTHAALEMLLAELRPGSAGSGCGKGTSAIGCRMGGRVGRRSSSSCGAPSSRAVAIIC